MDWLTTHSLRYCVACADTQTFPTSLWDCTVSVVMGLHGNQHQRKAQARQFVNNPRGGWVLYGCGTAGLSPTTIWTYNTKRNRGTDCIIHGRSDLARPHYHLTLQHAERGVLNRGTDWIIQVWSDLTHPHYHLTLQCRGSVIQGGWTVRQAQTCVRY